MKTLQDLSFALSCAAAGVVFAMVPAASVQAADIEAGKQKADQICAACHGADGNTAIDPSYPKLAGQHQAYLERTLLDYQADRRKNPIMAAQAKALSRQDIENVSAYYASLPSQLRVRR
jgi:cytochrome c553